MRASCRTIVLLASLLVGCAGEDSGVRLGAKNFSESRIVAEMAAVLLREQGVSDVTIVDYPNTEAILEALKLGDIDAYPEYNGTGLVMVGQNPIADGDEATARVRELYRPLDLVWLPRLGFANNYGLAMRPERAAALGIERISDLTAVDAELVFGIESDFVERPLDGLTPLLQRYGLTFSDTVTVPLDRRASLYDRLLDGESDLIEVFTTDGQIADYGLVLLEDDLGFFPVYQAAILARQASLERLPALEPALAPLAGRVDASLMQTLNGRVELEGLATSTVARQALAELGLIDAASAPAGDPLVVAVSPYIGTEGGANDALRVTRAAFEGRDVQLAPTHSPLEAVLEGVARLAVVGADDLFDFEAGAGPTRDERFEAVAPLGQNHVHIVAEGDGPARLADIDILATGPEGSSSARLAGVIAASLGLEVELQYREAEDLDTLIAALDGGEANAVLFSGQTGDAALIAASQSRALRLVPITGWSDGPSLVRYPFLRLSRIAADAYPRQARAIDTLSVQRVLVGPAADTTDVVGDLGPSSIDIGLSPLGDETVLAMNAAAPVDVSLDPTLRAAAALTPELPEPPAALNPAADISLLSLAVIALFVWLVYLYARPRYS